MPNDNDFALIVGINDYVELPSLSGPVSDAQAFQQWALSVNGGDIPPSNCKWVVAGKNPYRPTQDLIDEALDQITAGNGVFRRLYFFFAGHGVGLDWSSNGLCLPGWTSRFRSRLLSSKGYLDYTVGSSVFLEVYFFLDCCRDRLVNAVAFPPTLGLARPRGAGVASLVLYASDFENPAGEALDRDSSSTVRGFFSEALVQGLSGAAADRNGDISIESLVNFSTRKTAELAQAKNQTQTVNCQFYAPGKTMAQMIILSNVNPPTTAITIKFIRGGRVQLAGPTLDEVFIGVFAEGDIKGPLILTKGLYALSDLDNAKTLDITIDGTLKDIIYEF